MNVPGWQTKTYPKRKLHPNDFRGTKNPDKLHWKGDRRPVLCGTIMAYPLFADDPSEVDCSRCRRHLDKRKV